MCCQISHLFQNRIVVFKIHRNPFKTFLEKLNKLGLVTLHCISIQHEVGLYWVPGHAGVRGNEIADELARDGSVRKFVGPEPALGVCRRDRRRRISCWLVNQHWIWWQGLGDTKRQAGELILGPCLGAKARFLSFNGTQSRAITGLLTGHNTLRRPLHLMRLSDSPLCRRCGAEDETSAHILCECEAVASLTHALSGLLLLGARGHQECKSGGHLELQQSNRAPIN